MAQVTSVSVRPQSKDAEARGPRPPRPVAAHGRKEAPREIRHALPGFNLRPSEAPGFFVGFAAVGARQRREARWVWPADGMVVMNFSVLPPEINSALMFAGAGPGPMLAAASAWTGLAGDLGSAAASFSAVTSQLATRSWQGPASAAMTGVAASYARWLTTAAAQAEQAAGQAQAAVSAFEAALAADGASGRGERQSRSVALLGGLESVGAKRPGHRGRRGRL